MLYCNSSKKCGYAVCFFKNWKDLPRALFQNVFCVFFHGGYAPRVMRPLLRVFSIIPNRPKSYRSRRYRLRRVWEVGWLRTPTTGHPIRSRSRGDYRERRWWCSFSCRAWNAKSRSVQHRCWRTKSRCRLWCMVPWHRPRRVPETIASNDSRWESSVAPRE